MEVADDAILLSDLEGRHLYANSAYYAGLGANVGDDPNPDGFGAVHPDDVPMLRRNLSTLFERGVTMAEYRIKHTSGSWVVRASRSALVRDAEGKPSSIVSILRDITDRKRAEEARQKAEQQLHEARKLEALGTLSGGIAHDFNNVLAVMLMDAEELRNRLDPGDERRELAEELLACGLRGREMVRRILLFARRQEPSRRIIQLQEALPEALKPLRAALPPQVSLEVRIDPATPPTALDATQLYQVVSNLMSNALHALGETGGVLFAEAAPAALSASDCIDHPERRPGRYARLTLRDSGSGMSPETLARIFEPFFTTKSQGQGTGLGLAIVRSIVAAHDGFIAVESAPGQGTAFQLYFPAAAQEQLDAAEAAEPGKTAPALHLRLLLVDDEALLLRAVTRMLSRRGFEVTTCLRPAEALQLFTAQPERFNLAVVNLAMPEMSGLELAARLVAIRPGFPVLLASGNSSGVEPAQAHQAGIRELVSKPYDGNTLLAAVERVTQAARG